MGGRGFISFVTTATRIVIRKESPDCVQNSDRCFVGWLTLYSRTILFLRLA